MITKCLSNGPQAGLVFDVTRGFPESGSSSFFWNGFEKKKLQRKETKIFLQSRKLQIFCGRFLRRFCVAFASFSTLIAIFHQPLTHRHVWADAWRVGLTRKLTITWDLYYKTRRFYFYPWVPSGKQTSAFWIHTTKNTKRRIFFDAKFLTLTHRGKTKHRKTDIKMGKLGCFCLG